MFRIIIAMDIEAPSMKEAYRKLYQNMKKVDTEDFQWESTDEWFDETGEPLDEAEAQAVRMAVFSEENEK